VFNFRKSFVLSGLRISAVVCLFVITMIAAFNLAGCGGSASPSVTVTATLTTVDGSGGALGSGAAQTSTLTATVTNDQSTNGTPDGVTWSISGGGTLSNTTTTSATYTAPTATSSAQTVTITATSVADTSKTGSVTITVPALIASTTTTAQLTDVVGTVYSQQLTVSGGNGSNTWTTTLVSGSLPPGWSISTSGVLSGPTAPTAGQAGTYNFTVAVKDSGTYSADLSLTVTINPAPTITFGAAPTATGTYNVTYSSAVSATGGAGALSYSSTNLPSWLTLNASTGAITGMPTTAAEVTTYNFTVTASDNFGDSTTSSQYTIVVSYPAVVIAPAAGALPVAYAGSSYSSGNLTVSGGNGTGYTWSVASGSSLPSWLHFSSTTGATTTLTGTPTTAASAASFTLKVTDSVGNSQTVTYSVTVDAGISITPVSGALPVAYANLAYTSGTLTASGGSGTGYTWSVVSGFPLPSWLSLTSTSGATTTLTGTPTAQASAASFELKVTDSAGNSQTITYSVTVDAGITLSPSGGALPTAYANSLYSTTLTATGGSGSGQNWTVASGSTLPSWLSLNASTGVLSGTPTATASAASFSIKVTDSAGNTATGSYSVTVVAGIGITPSGGALPVAYANSAYSSGTLTAAGGNGNYTWSTVSGFPLPSWLSLSSTSGATTTLTGTPTSAASAASFELKVSDTAGNSQTVTYSVTVDAGISISPVTGTTLATAYANSPYTSVSLTASGGSGTGYTWSTVSGFLPPSWLSLSTTSGATTTLTGTPTATASAASFELKVTDSVGNSQTVSYSIAVGAGITITPPTIPTFYPGASYPTTTFTATGGAGGPYTWSWAAASGSTLPSGLSLSSTGTITGTPANATSSSVTSNVIVTAKDSGGNTVTTSVSITIEATLTITTTSPLPTGYIGSIYPSTSLAATGGSGTSSNYTWAVTGSNALPSGLSLSSSAGQITGTPTGSPSGPTSVTFQVTDTVANVSTTKALSITVNAGISITPVSGALPVAYANLAYTSGTLTASGGSGTGYTWSVVSGFPLPSWLSLTSTSGATTTLTGTPTAQASAASFELKVTDSAGNSQTITYSVTVDAGITLSPSGGALPTAYANSLYSTTLTATGGSGSGQNWTVASGSTLPSWLSLNASTGVLSGTPTATASAASFSIKVTDSAGNTATGSYSVTVVAGIGITPSGGALPVAYANSAYSSGTLTAAGGNGNYTWSTVSGFPLPSWLSLSSTSGATTTLTGTPTSAASAASFELKVSDTAGNSQTVTYSVTVDAGISISPVTGTTLPEAYANSPYNSGTITVTGGNAANGYSWSLTNSPSWLGLSPMAGSTGSLTGTPTVPAGPATFTLKVSDDYGNSQTVTYYVTVGAGITITPPTIPTFYPGASYPTTTFTATGGAGGPYTWSWAAASGSTLPSGLSLSTTGTITGTPANATSSSVTSNVIVTAKDSGGNTVTTSVSITIEATLTITTTSPLPTGVNGTAYSVQLHATGGAGGTVATGGTGTTTPYVWSVSTADANNLSTTLGLSLSSSGVLSGASPTTGGPVTFTADLSDGSGHTTTASLSVTINASLAITTATLPTTYAYAGSSYASGTITAVGGIAPYTWSITPSSPALTALDISLGSSTGLTNTLSGSVPSNASIAPVIFTVQIKDSTGVTATQQYTLTVYGALTQTPSPNPLPSVTVNQAYPGATITASGGSGSYSWSVSGTVTSVFTVNNNGNNLSISGTPTTTGTYDLYVTLTDTSTSVSTPQIHYTISVTPVVPTGYTVTGTVTYGGSKTGWVYLQLSPNSGCNNCNQNLGTAINATTAGSLASGMTFTIKGVPVGSYTLQAYMDIVGRGSPNANDPTGSLSGVTVTTSGASGQAVTLTDPATVTLGTSTPNWDPNSGYGAFSGGAIVSFDPIANGNYIEMPTSYNLQYSTSSTFSSGVTTKSFPAANGNSPWVVSGLTNGQTYYFRAAGVVGSTVGNYSAAEPSGGLLIATPTAGSLVSGTVTFTLPAGVSNTTGKTLYVGCYNTNTGNVYADPIADPVSAQAYSVYVPNGTNCQIFGFLDLNTTPTGLIGGAGELSNTNSGQGMITVTVNGATSGQNITLPSGNSSAEVLTDVNSSGGGTVYGVGFNISGQYKLPVAVELLSETPEVSGAVADVVVPADIATGAFSGYSDSFDYWPAVTGTPVVGDSYKLSVTYSDGTSETLTAAVTGVLTDAFVSDMEPQGTGVSTKPNFSWTDPSSAGSYVYQFLLKNSSGNTVWAIPPQHSSLTGFSSSITSITWDVDPTNSGDLPNSSYLNSGALYSSTNYNWQIATFDSYGNEAQVGASFTTTTTNLALTANYTGYGSALVGYPFTASITATGGSGTGYSFQVNDTWITATSLGSAMTFSGNDGLLAYYSGSTLYIVGTPTTAWSPLPLSVLVTDSESNFADQVFNLVVSSVPAPPGARNSLLSGTYVCKIDGYNDSDNSRWASLTSLVANGSGGITSGAWDSNSRDFTAEMAGTISSTSSYSVGSDYMGVLTMNSVITTGGTGTHTMTFAIALNDANAATTTATAFRMVEIDDVGTSPSGTHGSGVCYQATTSAFAASTLSGKSLAFSMQGENSSGVPKAYVGRMTLSTESSTGGTGGAAGGTITSGIGDGMRLDQSGDEGMTFANTTTYPSTYTVPNSTTGRFTLSITATGSTTAQTWVAYVIDADRMFWLETGGDTGMLAGDMRTQLQTTNTASALLDGSSVLYSQAYEGNSNGTVAGYDSSVYQVSGTGTDILTVNASFDDINGTYSAGNENTQTVTITLDSSNPGRATFSPGSDSAFFYFYNAGSAFYLDLNGSNHYLETGWLEAQTQPSSPPFANANIAGSIVSGALPRLSSGDNDSIAENTLYSSGGMTGSETQANAGSLQWDETFSSMGYTLGYSWLSTTYGSFSVSANGIAFESCIVVTPVQSGTTGKSVCLENTSSGANVTISQQ